jgi:hypothetical protein
MAAESHFFGSGWLYSLNDPRDILISRLLLKPKIAENVPTIGIITQTNCEFKLISSGGKKIVN